MLKREWLGRNGPPGCCASELDGLFVQHVLESEQERRSQDALRDLGSDTWEHKCVNDDSVAQNWERGKQDHG
jgi:hypothetical protein